ncbi:hypothetical protein MPDQ_000740 [Monascus purpureus]|uniref:Aflatoxin regulatory protein domain-containing protein n=1 Tax=Monascus purpureus TaxID=5098 RepID=A0A507QRD3_MONPU|nr:hypothetical protein MPDQ_000740 [Monascus purpureus]BDD59924.1 hypothetical protein MAP00_005094 [Monascus purpureus]
MTSTSTSTSAPCPCPPQIKHLSSTLPVQGSFDFSFLTTLTQPLDDLCKSIEGCRSPCHSASHSYNQDLNGPLVDLSDAVLSLCHAACTAYSLLDDELGPTATASGNGTATATPASHAASSLTCAKSPMALGKLTLQAEEETLLARQVVSAVLTNLSVLLRDVYLRGKETAGVDLDRGMGASSMRPGLYGREGAGPVSRCLSRVLALLGRLFSE